MRKHLMIVSGMFVCSSFLISVCMFIVSSCQVLLISSATVIVDSVVSQPSFLVGSFS